MKTEKTNDRYDENQTNRDGNWHVSADELQFYAETGFFADDDDWHDFLAVRKAQSLDYARSLNPNLMMSGPCLKAGMDSVTDLIQKQTGQRLYQKSRTQLNCLLANLFWHYCQSQTLWTMVPRGHETTVMQKYNPMLLNWETVAKICDALTFAGFIHMEIGHTETAKGKNDSHLTRIRAASVLMDLLHQHDWQQNMLHYHPKTEPILMKKKPAGKKTSKVIDYTNTVKSNQTRQLLFDYHHFLRRHEILLPTTYDTTVPDLIFMRQIFSNGSWDEGGRLFGGAYQQLSKTDRQQITIDNETVIEIDISSCHATMAFAEAGIDWFASSNQDIYQRDDLRHWPRDIIKRAFNIAINAENEKKTLSALTNTSTKDGWFLDWPDLKQPGWQNALLNDIKEAYPELAQLLFKRRGMVYMQQEGEICIAIIKEAMSRGITVLTLHDSFITPRKHAATMRVIISDAFKSVVGARCQLT